MFCSRSAQIRYEVYHLLGRPRRLRRQWPEDLAEFLDSTASVMEQGGSFGRSTGEGLCLFAGSLLRQVGVYPARYLRRARGLSTRTDEDHEGEVWDEVCKKVFPDLEKRPKLLAMQGSALQEAHAVDVGLYAWLPRKCSRSVPYEVSGISWTTFMKIRRRSWGSAFPSYRDYYAEGNDGPRRGFIGPHRGKTLTRAWIRRSGGSRPFCSC